MSRTWMYVIAGLAGFLLAAAWIIYMVFTSKSSTAAIGLLFVPMYGALAALAMLAAAFAVFALIDARAGRVSLWRLLPALGVVAAFALLAAVIVNYRIALAVATDTAASDAQLQAVIERQVPLWRHEIDKALLKNPALSSVLIERLMARDAGNAVTALAGAHPNAGVDLLGRIVAGAREYDRVWGVAANPRITPEFAAHLADVSVRDFPGDLEYKLYQSHVLSRLASNPATPQAVFDRLAAWPSPAYHFAVAVIYAPRASCDQIRRAGDTEHGNAVLKNTAQGQLNKRKCPL